MKPTIVHPAAFREMEEAAQFYEDRKEGLGKAFLEEVARSLGFIQEFPGMGSQFLSTRYRHFVAKRFPYVIFYFETSDAIQVYAVAHGKRRPGYWTKRSFE